MNFNNYKTLININNEINSEQMDFKDMDDESDNNLQLSSDYESTYDNNNNGISSTEFNYKV